MGILGKRSKETFKLNNMKTKEVERILEFIKETQVNDYCEEEEKEVAILILQAEMKRLKELQCHAIYEKVKEAWTPEQLYVDWNGLVDNINTYTHLRGNISVKFLKELFNGYIEFQSSSLSALKEEFDKEQGKEQTAEDILKKYWIDSIDNPETRKTCIIQAMEEYADEHSKCDKTSQIEWINNKNK